MYEGNELSTLEVIDGRLSSTINFLIWSIANVKNTDLSKVKKRHLLKALEQAKDAVNMALEVIDDTNHNG